MRELYEEKTGYVRENHRGDDKTENSEKTESAQNSSQPQTGEKGEESAGRRKGFGRRDRFFWTAEDRKTESTCFP